MIKFRKLLFVQKKLVNITKMYTSKVKPVVDLAYDLYGTGSSAPPLIILHSLCGCKSNWRSICLLLKDKLNPSRKIYAIDARNHGSSDYSNDHSYELIAEDVANFLQQQNIKKAAVMGHSMGGRAMMYLALKHQNLVDRAIIMDASPVDKPPYADLVFSKIVLSIMKNASLLPNFSLAQNRAAVGDRIRQIISKEFAINFLLRNLEEIDNHKYSWALNIDALQNYLNNIDVFPKNILANKFLNPVLFIGGSNSHFINKDMWPAIQQSFPKSELTWVDAGHLLHIEQPEDIVKLILNFLNQTKDHQTQTNPIKII